MKFNYGLSITTNISSSVQTIYASGRRVHNQYTLFKMLNYIDSSSSVQSLCEGIKKCTLCTVVKMVINMDDFTVLSLQAAPFTVRSTPDFRNTNGMEQKTVT
jgi:hypothetical protein